MGEVHAEGEPDPPAPLAEGSTDGAPRDEPESVPEGVPSARVIENRAETLADTQAEATPERERDSAGSGVARGARDRVFVGVGLRDALGDADARVLAESEPTRDCVRKRVAAPDALPKALIEVDSDRERAAVGDAVALRDGEGDGDGEREPRAEADAEVAGVCVREGGGLPVARGKALEEDAIVRAGDAPGKRDGDSNALRCADALRLLGSEFERRAVTLPERLAAGDFEAEAAAVSDAVLRTVATPLRETDGDLDRNGERDGEGETVGERDARGERDAVGDAVLEGDRRDVADAEGVHEPQEDADWEGDGDADADEEADVYTVRVMETDARGESDAALERLEERDTRSGVRERTTVLEPVRDATREPDATADSETESDTLGVRDVVDDGSAGRRRARGAARGSNGCEGISSLGAPAQ